MQPSQNEFPQQNLCFNGVVTKIFVHPRSARCLQFGFGWPQTLKASFRVKKNMEIKPSNYYSKFGWEPLFPYKRYRVPVRFWFRMYPVLFFAIKNSGS